jgi:hypothetical protein
MMSDPMKLPRIAAWREARGGSPHLFDFLSESADAALAVAFSRLYWPVFIEVRGCILIEDKFQEATFLRWWDELDGDCRRIEEVVNHTHLWDLFEDDDSASADALKHVADILARTWRCALRDQFPSRAVDVYVLDEPAEYGPTIVVRSSESCQ